MKVLHMISGGDSGGAKTHVFALMRELPKLCDVKIVCFIKGQFFDELSQIDVKSELVEQKSRFDLSVLDRLCQIIKEDGIQIIHAHGARANFIASKLKKRVSIPVVTTVHSDYLLDFDVLYKKLFFTRLNVNALKKLDYYIGVSSNFKDMLISRGFRPNSVFTVYNGMDYSSPMTFCSKEEFARRIGLDYDENTAYVGIIGRHDRVKGQDIFLKAAAKVLKTHKNVRFVIAGDGDGRAELVSLAQSLGISDKLTFAGFVKDIYSFLNFIDINVLSSRCESFPYVLMEGARMKKPTVSSAVGGIPDLIEDGVTGLLFANENYSELAEKITALIDDKPRAERLGQALHERAVTRFSSKSLAQTHADIYRAILRDRADKKRYDAVVSGYYGFNNSGDDALLLGMIDSLKRQMPDIRLVVLSKNPDSTKKRYRVDSMKRFSLCGVKKAVSGSHLLINGGGSLIQDATSFKSLLYYLAVIKYAKRKGLKVFVCANGIGPLKDKNKPLAARVLNTTDMITLRDSESLAVLESMSVKDVPVKLSADPAILLEPIRESAARAILNKENVPENAKILAVAVRPWQQNDAEFDKKIASLCDKAYEKFGLTSVFVPMKPSSDRRFSQSICALTKHKSYCIDGEYEVREIMGIIALSEAVVGMRLHTLIYSLAASVPCVGVTYDPKIDGFLKYIGADMTVSAASFDENRVLNYISEIESDREKICAELEKSRAALREKASQNARIAVDML